MLQFPDLPKWWFTGAKFMHLNKSFTPPDYIIGYDTETYMGDVLTHQFVTSKYGERIFDEKIQWVTGEKILDKFLDYVEQFEGYIIVFCFNAKFDLAILLRKFIKQFLNDDFEVKYRDWTFQVFCSKNWHATFKHDGYGIFIRFLDINNFFLGSLESVSDTFGFKGGKLKRPEGLGNVKYSQNDKYFIKYAMKDSWLDNRIGQKILDMHEEFDIPMSSSSANLAEKVFRRMFIKEGDKIKFPPFSALRLSELTYHGGKNGYYLDGPTLVKKCYEYDFNAAYGYAMYTIPSFLSGVYKKVNKFCEDVPGVYDAVGMVQPCKYGVLYDTRFNYFRFPHKQRVRTFATNFELMEAIRSKEFKIDKISGWIFKPDTTENPVKEYARYFWEKKNSTPKGDVRYLFYKLCLNSLYGKWIQRNPQKIKYTFKDGSFEWNKQNRDMAGGLYHPFIASLITGFTRARLHEAEHHFNAIECSTDSVKSKIYDRKHDKHNIFGMMQLEYLKCKQCGNDKIKTFDGLFLRNRLNLLLDEKEHVLKKAMHGFWGKDEELKKLWKNQENTYFVNRMPMIREALTQMNTEKKLFQMYEEERFVDIPWHLYKVIK